jgi:cobalt-zinc-cadmium efflux system outer membrane protein
VVPRPLVLVLSVLSLVALRAGAQTTPRGISLAQARAAAVRVGPEVLLAEQREAVSRAQVEVAGTLANPTLTLQSARLTARLSAGVSVPVPLFGQRSTAVAASRADAEAVRLDTTVLRVEARWSATRAWLDLWEAQERARTTELAAGEADRLASIAQERFAAGSAPRLDAVRTSADRARARAEAQAAGVSVAAAAARLASWLGATEGPALRAEGAPDLGPLPSPERAREQVIARHPALARDRAQGAAAAARVRAEQRQRWPVVSAQLTVNQGDPTLPGTDVIGGLSFEAPVLNQRGGAIDRARAEQTLAETTTDVEGRRLSAELDDAFAQARAAELRARALGAEVLPALEEARRMTEEGYRDGHVDLLRVLESQRAALEGRTAYVEARAAWQRARADVERALGDTDGEAARAP